MSSPLEHWAVIDIETTGIHPGIDEIIDVGFVQFEGTKLVKSYHSLVACSTQVSKFIQKLTGITNEMLQKAPEPEVVSGHLSQLKGCQLIAHNADFEQSFLQDFMGGAFPSQSYQDSLLYLALLFPGKDTLNLEHFIRKNGIAQKETHRGFEDAVDLLKVLLVTTLNVKKNKAYYLKFKNLLQYYGLDHYWYYHFLNLSDREIEEIGEQIHFSPYRHCCEQQKKKSTTDTKQDTHSSPSVRREFSRKGIEEIYNSKAINNHLPQYHRRDSQRELSFKVGQSFKNHVHAIIQAPTGIGKTLGYLIPSALFTLETKKQVLISTGTKVLQKQIVSTEITRVRNILGLQKNEWHTINLVGSKNHLCELLFREMDDRPPLLSTRTFEESFTDLYFDLVFLHNAQASYEDKIIRTDLPYVLKKKIPFFRKKSESIAVDFRSCSNHKCPLKDNCSYMTGLREAKKADLIVGNHALMFSWPQGSFKPEHIVVDEAHKMEEEATKAYVFEWGQSSAEALLQNLKHLTPLTPLFQLLVLKEENRGQNRSLIDSIKRQAEETFKALHHYCTPLKELVESYFKERQNTYSDIFWNELPMVEKRGNPDSLEDVLYNHFEAIKNLIAEFSQLLRPYVLQFQDQETSTEEAGMITHFETFVDSLEDMQTALEFSLEKQEGYSRAIRYHQQDGHLLYSAPVDIGKVIHTHLLSDAQSVIFTSATLGHPQGDTTNVEWATGHTYLKPEKRFQKATFLPPIFDYKNKARIYLCHDVPSLYDARFVSSTLTKVLPLIQAMGGRGLLLFSARTRFEQAREFLLNELWGKMPVFIQGMGEQVIEEFKQAGTGILLGMESFSEGIDLPGDVLRFLFIDKIPDMRKSLVSTKRQQFYGDQFGNAFVDYYLSHRARSLHQKLGRLLRSQSDSGGAIVVDSRISRWRASTVDTFLHMMNPYVIKRSSLDHACVDLEKFLL